MVSFAEVLVGFRTCRLSGFLSRLDKEWHSMTRKVYFDRDLVQADRRARARRWIFCRVSGINYHDYPLWDLPIALEAKIRKVSK